MASSRNKLISIQCLGRFIRAIEGRGALIWLMSSLLALGSGVSSAQTYRMSCQLEGVIPSLEDLKMPPAQVTFEMQNFGANLFLKIIGPKPYATFFNTLDTDKLEGRNLSSPKALLLRSKHRITGQETEVRIERQTAAVSGHMDIMHMGAMVRMELKGKCTP
jgi:hypothetical protein